MTKLTKAKKKKDRKVAKALTNASKKHAAQAKKLRKVIR